MSGRKQHYIPQLLLRGFGKQGKGKAIQVTIYSRDRGIFTTATDGAAARRYFYSEHPSGAQVETLDDRITAYETRLAEIVAEFRATTPGTVVDAGKAAEAAAHFCVRPAHIRDSFGSAAGQLVAGVEDKFLGNKNRLREAMGLNAQDPSGTVLEEIRKIYDSLGPLTGQSGVTKPQFERWAFAQIKGGFDSSFPELLPHMRKLLGSIQSETENMARQGHVKALSSDLAPELRVDEYKRLIWTIRVGPANSCVLPDCVDIGVSTSGQFLPLAYTAKDETSAVIVPLSHDRLLIGGNDKDLPQSLNEISAACSWEFFVAPDRRADLEQLVPRIGKRTQEFLTVAIADALAKKE